MKFYILKHPVHGYLCGNRVYKHFHENINKSRKFNQRNFAASCKKMSYGSINECEIICIEFKEFTETLC